MKRAWIAALLVLAACADSSRDNPLDPVNAPTLEMSTPILMLGRSCFSGGTS